MAIPKDVHIVIVGAGIGGLATALALAKEGFTHIEVYETASDLGFVGAGIQLAPNMARILDRLGVWGPIAKDATKLDGASIRKGSTDEELAYSSLMWVEEAYGYQHMVGHRASLAGELYRGCQREQAIRFAFGASVTEVRAFAPRPVVAVSPRSSGGAPHTVECDVLLGADGIKSRVRACMMAALGADASVEDSGQAAYRIVLTEAQMQDDPELLALLKGNRSTRWIGDGKHMIAYPVAGKTMYNISTAHPATSFAAAPDAAYTTRGSKAALLARFADFAPTPRKLLARAPDDAGLCEWRLRAQAPLPAWAHGGAALLGDACHAALPHLNQGAAQAVEDAAAVALALALAPDARAASVAAALRVYERVRKRRAEACAALAAANGAAMQLGEGAAAAARDAAFRAFRERGEGAVPDKAADRDVLGFLYGWDAAKETREQYDSIFESVAVRP